MTHTPTTSSHLVPTSSRHRGRPPRGDLVPRPHIFDGDEVNRDVQTPHTNHQPRRPKDDLRDEVNP